MTPRKATERSIEALNQRLRCFVASRDWAHLHTPRSLTLALVGEVGELAAELRWLSDPETMTLTETRRAQVRDELADVLIFLAHLADVLEIDLLEAANEKMDRNELRFPAP